MKLLSQPIEEKEMETAVWIAKAIAGAILGQSAKDAYGAVRKSLKTKFGLGSAVAMIEENPQGETEQKLLAEKLHASGAVNHAEFQQKVDILVEALKQSTDLPPQAQVLINDICAGQATFRDIIATGGGSIKVEGIDVENLVVENVRAKS